MSHTEHTKKSKWINFLKEQMVAWGEVGDETNFLLTCSVVRSLVWAWNWVTFPEVAFLNSSQIPSEPLVIILLYPCSTTCTSQDRYVISMTKVQVDFVCVCVCVCVCVRKLSNVQLLVTPWMVACQDPLSMGFFKQEYWNGWPFTPPGESSLPKDLHCRWILYHWATGKTFYLKWQTG